MNLALIEPDGSDNHDRMFFECVCGSEYQLSDRVSDLLGQRAQKVRAGSRLKRLVYHPFTSVVV